MSFWMGVEFLVIRISYCPYSIVPQLLWWMTDSAEKLRTTFSYFLSSFLFWLFITSYAHKFVKKWTQSQILNRSHRNVRAGRLPLSIPHILARLSLHGRVAVQLCTVYTCFVTFFIYMGRVNLLLYYETLLQKVVALKMVFKLF